MALAAPLDVIIVRKLGVPYQPELAMGAIGEGGVKVVEESVVLSARLAESRQIEDSGTAGRGRSSMPGSISIASGGRRCRSMAVQP